MGSFPHTTPKVRQCRESAGRRCCQGIKESDTPPGLGVVSSGGGGPETRWGWGLGPPAPAQPLVSHARSPMSTLWSPMSTTPHCGAWHIRVRTPAHTDRSKFTNTPHPFSHLELVLLVPLGEQRSTCAQVTTWTPAVTPYLLPPHPMVSLGHRVEHKWAQEQAGLASTRG